MPNSKVNLTCRNGFQQVELQGLIRHFLLELLFAKFSHFGWVGLKYEDDGNAEKSICHFYVILVTTATTGGGVFSFKLVPLLAQKMLIFGPFWDILSRIYALFGVPFTVVWWVPKIDKYQVW